MGYIRHHAVILTSCFDSHLEEEHRRAQELLDDRLVSPIIPSLTNGYRTFFVAPDGSKEGWETSDQGDEARKTLLDGLDYHVQAVIVSYGGDDPENAHIERVSGLLQEE